MVTAHGGANAAQNGFPDEPIFDGGKAEELHTWIIQLRNNFPAQPHRYPDDQACLRYAINRLSGAALCLIRGYVSENTGRIRLESLNALLDLLGQAFDDPFRTRTANCEIRKLKQKSGTFAAHFAEFGWIMGDLNWNEEAQRKQLYEDLSDEIKDALVTSRPRSDSLGHLIQIFRELDTRIRAHAAERVQPGRTQRLPRSGPSLASTPTLAPANPTGTNSRHYGMLPMDLSAMQRTAEKNRIRQESMARGEYLYFGTVGHFLRECPERAASRNRHLAMAATVNTTAEPDAAIPNEQFLIVMAAVLQGTQVSSGDASGSGSGSAGGKGTGTGMERERKPEWEGNGNGNGNGRQRWTASDGRVGQERTTSDGPVGQRDGQRRTDVLDRNGQRQTDVSNRETNSVGQTCRTERRTASDGRVGQ